MSADRLAEIKARADAATPGPWSTADDVPWLVAQVDRLEAWRAEALGIIDYRGEQQRRAEDERDNALAEVARLTAERDDMAWQRTQALNERDALAARVAQVKALADHWAKRAASDYEAGGTLTWGAADVHFSAVLRDALAGSIGQEAAPDAGHKCEPYYSRAECGRCGWQEQWCATCSRQMCRCATDAMGADQ